MGRKHPRNGAFTRIELLVVGLVLVILIAVLMPGMIQKKRSAQLAGCVANQKQVILGELLWINDSETSRLSWQISTNGNGSLEYLEGGKLYPHFKALSNELVSTGILICPTDNRGAAKSFNTLDDSNLSYFMNMDFLYGGPNWPIDKLILPKIFGDRNVTNDTGPRAGILRVTIRNYASLRWDSRMHNGSRTVSQTFIGNVATLDGSVATVASTNLQETFQYAVYDDATNRLAIP